MEKSRVTVKTAISSERSLKEVEAMYGSLIEMLPAIVYVADPLPPYAPIYVSSNIESLGYTLDEWLQKPDNWLSIIHPEDKEWVLQQTQEFINQGQGNDYEYRVIAKDGTIHWLHDRGKFVLNEAGEPVCWQGVLLDITARKQAEAERESLIEQLQQSLAEVKTLSGLLPICASCKSVRDDQGYWQQIENYLAKHTQATLSHSICRPCAKKLYPKYYDAIYSDVEKQ